MNVDYSISGVFVCCITTIKLVIFTVECSVCCCCMEMQYGDYSKAGCLPEMLATGDILNYLLTLQV